MLKSTHALSLGLALLLVMGCSESTSGPETKQPVGMMSTPFIVPPTDNPTVHLAESVDVPDEALVVGVVVGEKSRAYLLEAMSSLMSHVVNDVIDKTPVSVTFYDRTNCTRVFTDIDIGAPLNLKQGGFKDGLLLSVGPHFFEQKTGHSYTPDVVFPYTQMPHEVTTWGPWKQAHPETSIYIGERRRPNPTKSRD